MIQKDHIRSNTLDIPTYITLGIAKPAIRPPIPCPIRSSQIWYLFYIKNDVFSSLVPTIDNMEIFVLKGQTNMKSTIYRLL
jgi:hypothetical protein